MIDDENRWINLHIQRIPFRVTDLKKPTLKVIHKNNNCEDNVSLKNICFHPHFIIQIQITKCYIFTEGKDYASDAWVSNWKIHDGCHKLKKKG